MIAERESVERIERMAARMLPADLDVAHDVAVDALLAAETPEHAVAMVRQGVRWAKARWARDLSRRPAMVPLDSVELAMEVREPGCGQALLAAVERLLPSRREAVRASLWSGRRLSPRERVLACRGRQDLAADAALRREVKP